MKSIKKIIILPIIFAMNAGAMENIGVQPLVEQIAPNMDELIENNHFLGNQIYQIAGELREAKEKYRKSQENLNALREMMKLLNTTNNGLKTKLEELCEVDAIAHDERINYQMQIEVYSTDLNAALFYVFLSSKSLLSVGVASQRRTGFSIKDGAASSKRQGNRETR